ncbi:MAG: haloacid dehalogenase domain-containing protein hydrolase [Candidatus Bathyarchaeota archaeon B24]|nr:MAG: haloacid dehalogenase domain-containing protein hydrolase [Candidatus Bathyarchaeota archaeon B24]
MRETISGLRNLIFDLDETLVLLPVDWGVVYRDIGRLLGREVTSFAATLPMLWGSDMYWKVSRLVEEYELKSLSKLVVLDDSPSIVRGLRKDYRLSITSLQSRKVIERVLHIMGVRELFDILVSREDKPTRREQIRLVLTAGGYEASETMMVGDRVDDVVSALKNGCRAALVVRKTNELENLRKLGLESKTLTLRSLKELYEVLKRTC